MRHALIAVLVAGAAAALAGAVANDFYLRILFNIGIYFLCASGMNGCVAATVLPLYHVSVSSLQ